MRGRLTFQLTHQVHTIGHRHLSPFGYFMERPLATGTNTILELADAYARTITHRCDGLKPDRTYRRHLPVVPEAHRKYRRHHPWPERPVLLRLRPKLH